MGGRTLDQFRSRQQAKSKKDKETDLPKVPKKEDSKRNSEQVATAAFFYFEGAYSPSPTFLIAATLLAGGILSIAQSHIA